MAALGTTAVLLGGCQSTTSKRASTDLSYVASTSSAGETYTASPLSESVLSVSQDAPVPAKRSGQVLRGLYRCVRPPPPPELRVRRLWYLYRTAASGSTAAGAPRWITDDGLFRWLQSSLCRCANAHEGVDDQQRVLL